ncbi:MAG: CPBP family intramembrane metalloprotease [Clostridia bacterium]|nr:CPBP family intramembrane metalloprotease [Clostridia bacterium]
MTKLRELTQRYVIVFVVVLTVAFHYIMHLVSYVSSLFTSDLLIYDSISILLNMIWPVGLALLLGYGFVFKQKGFGKTLKAGAGFAAVYFLFSIFSVATALQKPNAQWQSSSAILVSVVLLIGIGLREELLFRGVIANALALKYAKSTKGIWLTVLVSSAAFGSVHLFNYFAGVNFGTACLQSLVGMAAGAMFCAVYLRGGNVFAIMLIHSLVDFSGLFQSLFLKNNGNEIDQMNQLSWNSMIMIPLFFLLVAFLLRKSKRPAVLERMETLRETYGIKA